jgi:hypothetical protein
MNPKQELELLEQLIDQLLAGIQDVIQSGEILSDEFQGALAQELEATTSRIDELKVEISQVQEAPQAAISPDAQLLWVLSGQQEQAFISYLRTFPTPQTQALLNNPTALSHTIEQLSRMMPQGEPPVIDGIQHADLNSSNIWGTQYNPKTGKMKVRFQGGAEYEYDGVPENIYKAFSKGNVSAKTKGRNQYGEWWPNKNPSLGAAMNQYIKAGNFPYRRLR